MTDTDLEPSETATPPTDVLEPGSAAARDQGCGCSVVANASYRSARDAYPLVDPQCPLHTMP